MSTDSMIPTGERGKLMLEAAAIASELRTLNERIGGLGMTPKNLREERRDQFMRQRAEKAQRLLDLKKQFDALADSKPAK